MNIGLSYLTQIRGGEDTGQLTADDDSQNGPRKQQTLGGWVALTFNQIVASLLAGYHHEHNADDTHSTIHASGAIYERSRTTAIGEWIDAPYSAGDFTASGTMTWTVTSAQINALRYTLVGKTMTLSFNINGSTLGGAASGDLQLKIPAMCRAKANYASAATRVNNGTNYAGSAITFAGQTYVALRTFNDGNWDTASTATIVGQISFEVQ